MIGSSLLSAGVGLLNSNSQKKQAKATLAANTDIANKTLDQQQAQFGEVKSASQPFLGLGNQAVGNLANPQANFLTSPGYEFRKSEGTQGVLGSTALNGLLRGGGAIKALSRFNQGLASDEYGKWDAQQRGNASIGLSGLGSLSSAAAGNAAALGANAANITNANNTASADLNTASNAGYNALAGGLGGLAASPTVNTMFQSALAKLKTPTVSGGGSSYTLPAYGGRAA